MAPFFDKLFKKRTKLKRNFVELYIETSFACNLSCIMCPMGAQIKGQGLMSYETFKKILPDINLFKAVGLSGFGEPLIHKEIVKMVRDIKKQNIFTNITTNGTLLSSNLTKELIDAGLDLMTFSIDASKKESYEKIRIGSHFETVLKNIETFTDLSLKQGSNTHSQWVYILMKNNLDEVLDALLLSKEVGVSRFIAKHMETATDLADFSQALFNTFYAPDLTEEEAKKREQILQELKNLSEKFKIDLVIHPTTTYTCIARPPESLFIDYNGNVSPCCYLTKHSVRTYLINRENKDFIIGNVHQESLAHLMDNKSYQAFICKWIKNKIPLECKGCVQIARMGLNPNL